MLQFITNCHGLEHHLNITEQVLKGGCRWIQLRMKEAKDKEILQTAKHMMDLCKTYNAQLILDDHVEIAKQVNADGVHLGKKDMSTDQARKILQQEQIIGGTANTFADIQYYHQQGAVNYIGLGPFQFTQTKKNLSSILGLESYRTIIQAMKQEQITLPVVAIGGITINDIPPLMQTGITGIALSGTIIQSDKITETTQQIIQLIEQYKQ